MKPLLVTCWMTSPLAGDAPHLDAILEWAYLDATLMAGQSHGIDAPGADLLTPNLAAHLPAPPPGIIPIPIRREDVGPWKVACCSSPILDAVTEAVANTSKRLSASENALLLAESERKMIRTDALWTKSYRLPVRLRTVQRVRWFAFGKADEVLRLLAPIPAIGLYRCQGYGRVSRWEVRDAPEDYSWFALTPEGKLVLMRPLPLRGHTGTPWLPTNMVGFRQHFGACCPPYWHPERQTDVVIPC